MSLMTKREAHGSILAAVARRSAARAWWRSRSGAAPAPAGRSDGARPRRLAGCTGASPDPTGTSSRSTAASPPVTSASREDRPRPPRRPCPPSDRAARTKARRPDPAPSLRRRPGAWPTSAPRRTGSVRGSPPTRPTSGSGRGSSRRFRQLGYDVRTPSFPVPAGTRGACPSMRAGRSTSRPPRGVRPDRAAPGGRRPPRHGGRRPGRRGQRQRGRRAARAGPARPPSGHRCRRCSSRSGPRSPAVPATTCTTSGRGTTSRRWAPWSARPCARWRPWTASASARGAGVHRSCRPTVQRTVLRPARGRRTRHAVREHRQRPLVVREGRLPGARFGSTLYPAYHSARDLPRSSTPPSSARRPDALGVARCRPEGRPARVPEQARAPGGRHPPHEPRGEVPSIRYGTSSAPSAGRPTTSSPAPRRPSSRS